MKQLITLIFILFLILLSAERSIAQQANLAGNIRAGEKGLKGATLSLKKTTYKTLTDQEGHYSFTTVAAGTYEISVTAIGYITHRQQITLAADSTMALDVEMREKSDDLNEVVVTGTMKAVRKLDSPVPVEVYTPAFFQKNPTPSLFEAVGLINGVRPQLNCNICNTGDIHINGLEGAYTLILIDGMPIISSLSTVYGLSGIPNSLVDHIEVVKGPASSLYGSEAMGGVINVITKNAVKAPLFSFDAFGTTWQEYNLDASVKFSGKNFQSLLGVNYFNYQHPTDKNGDGFTDVTLQHRISVFNKWNFVRKEKREASLAARFVNEDRWGGQMNWNKDFRGSDSIYGESIYTRRWELIGLYQLPVKEKIMLQLSYNWHHQNSYYGYNPFIATQQVGFAQMYWDKELGKKHNLLLGATYRYTWYDDNTPATSSANGLHNMPATTPLPGIFIQDEWKFSEQQTLLTGYRYDYDRYHGSIHSPRLAYKFSPNPMNTLRASFGTGFRVVNLFTEDHAALTGARQVVIAEALKPERSYNGNLNYVKKVPAGFGLLNLDVTGFYSYFTNKITGDFDQDPDKIIYANLNGHAISRGIAVNTEMTFNSPLRISAGLTWSDVYQLDNNGNGTEKTRQLHAPKWSGNYLISYTFPGEFVVDLTGVYTGPMRLPVQPRDYRPEYSPWFTLANIQLTKKFDNGLEIYGGIKNILNFIPKYALIRAFDPFDKTAADPVSNPNGYTFDTEYNYAPLQGIRGFAGVRYNLFKY
ncbi:outer membrane receptor for ferrienterochelin and colicins [Pedobacter westerhofensis]|uniref:Outer membrane receptor for ferrienterochelin and colicins n=1 Tax=Pedobacter westerhofensis TaxID=425512 RepID=A0A521F5U3_9SPHI|nr:TonB-dependent receptor [Pedobacter westerhofensis]SMO91588.1 outer membrane receptor for ferrienterochelin and colicins [Pedobacter westerhofensis]